MNVLMNKTILIRVFIKFDLIGLVGLWNRWETKCSLKLASKALQSPNSNRKRNVVWIIFLGVSNKFCFECVCFSKVILEKNSFYDFSEFGLWKLGSAFLFRVVSIKNKKSWQNFGQIPRILWFVFKRRGNETYTSDSNFSVWQILLLAGEKCKAREKSIPFFIKFFRCLIVKQT